VADTVVKKNLAYPTKPSGGGGGGLPPFTGNAGWVLEEQPAGTASWQPPSGGPPLPHAPTHESGGTDELLHFFEFTTDPQGRQQFNHIPPMNPGNQGGLFRGGQNQVDGDPNFVEHDGIDIWSRRDPAIPMTNTDWALARVKAARFGLEFCVAGNQFYAWRTDADEEYTKNDAGVVVRHVLRSDGRRTANEWNDAIPVYPVYPFIANGPGTFTTIASAIAQAVADGHTDNTNPALIRVYPQAGGWAEDVALSAGIHIEGVPGAPGSVQVRSLSYTPGPGLDEVSGIVQVRGITTFAGAGIDAVALLGTNYGRLILLSCAISKTANGAANVRCDCSGVSSGLPAELVVADCTGDVPAGGLSYQATAGKLTIERSDISGGAAARSLLIDGAAFVVGILANFFSAGADVINLGATASALLVNCFLSQATAGSDGIVQAGGSQLTLTGTLVNVPSGAGYAARGVGTFAYANNSFADNSKVQVPGLTLAPLATLPTPTP